MHLANEITDTSTIHHIIVWRTLYIMLVRHFHLCARKKNFLFSWRNRVKE